MRTTTPRVRRASDFTKVTAGASRRAGALIRLRRAADSFEQRGAKRLNKSARQREAKRLKALPEEDVEAYDRVLVDADLHPTARRARVRDGRQGHLLANVATERCASLIGRGLLYYGTASEIKNGGVLVYGTCSLTSAEREC